MCRHIFMVFGDIVISQDLQYPKCSNMSHTPMCPSFTIHPQDIFSCQRIFRNVTYDKSWFLYTFNYKYNHPTAKYDDTADDCYFSMSSSVAPVSPPVLDVGPEEVWLPALTPWSMTKRPCTMPPHPSRQFYSKSRTQTHHIRFVACSIKTH